MSDQALSALLDELEQLLGAGEPEGPAIADWHERFRATMATAERGADWPEIVTRCHRLALQLDQAADHLSAAREGIRRELDLQGQGARALKGYRPS